MRSDPSKSIGYDIILQGITQEKRISDGRDIAEIIV
jgi:hypothetical protein